MEIKEIMKSTAPLVDAVMERHLPREPTHEHLNRVFGVPRYAYNKEAIRKAFTEPVWDMLYRGGKRWRPALFLLLVEAFGGDPKRVNDFVMIPEMVHNGTLIHDDIEDSSELRRGQPCTHIKYGVDIAVNAGSTMFYWSLLPLVKNTASLSPDVRARAYDIYAQEMLNLGYGQAADIAWHRGMANADAITEDEYLQMCAYKTGTLARMSARLAALLSGATDEQIEAVGKFAEAIGVAFQIQDDILNITPSGVSEAKGLGEDMTEGKRSLLVIHTLKHADTKDRERLLEILGAHTSDQELRNEAIGIIRRYGAIEYCRGKARELVEDAWADVDGVLQPSDAKEKLRAFAAYLIERDV